MYFISFLNVDIYSQKMLMTNLTFKEHDDKNSKNETFIKHLTYYLRETPFLFDDN